MGNKSSSGGSSLERSRNSKVNAQLQKERQVADQQVKLLLLGTGESGKSTIFKQMRILYGEGFSDDSRKSVAPDLCANLVEGAQEILKYGKEMKCIDREAKTLGSVLMSVKDTRVLDRTVADAIVGLWANPSFLEAWEKRSLYQVQDTWGEFATELTKDPEWGAPGWVPSVQDVMRGRIRTSGVVDEVYTIRNVTFRMFDVGGQRNERRKWIHCFEDVTAVIFVAAISEYDQVLFEDATQNRLVEAFSLFEEISNSEWFKNTAMILFLNKRDLFVQKLTAKKIPLNISGLFDDAPGGSKKAVDYDTALKWLTGKFAALAPDNKDLYTHVTCATDTQNISTVFNASAEIILKQNLLLNGLMGKAPQ
jgi:guanine nucleotide-binding protein G(i) subunit alpha